MSKSIYSLVLSDELVEMVDAVAYKKGMNRSNFINSVLAEYVGFKTPQKRFEDIFRLLDDLIMNESRLRLENDKKDSRFLIVSALNYKYSPRITYAVDLTFSQESLGDLVISYRTQKEELCDLIDSFFARFIQLEKQAFGEENIRYRLKDGKLIRNLRPCLVFDADILSSNIMAYINVIDKLLNYYIIESPLIRDENLAQRFIENINNIKI